MSKISQNNFDLMKINSLKDKEKKTMTQLYMMMQFSCEFKLLFLCPIIFSRDDLIF